MSARAAFLEAACIVRSKYPDAEFIRVCPRARSEASMQDEPIDGRISLNGYWWFHFYAPSQDVSLSVSVPALGRIRVQDDGSTYRNVISCRLLVPKGDEWLDSVDALAIADSNGGVELRGVPGFRGISMTLGIERTSIPTWEIKYSGYDGRGPIPGLTVIVDARSGQIIPPRC